MKKPGRGFRRTANWPMRPPTLRGEVFALGTAGAGYGATVVNLKGGLGSASAITPDGINCRRHVAPLTRSAVSPSAIPSISGQRPELKQATNSAAMVRYQNRQWTICAIR